MKLIKEIAVDDYSDYETLNIKRIFNIRVYHLFQEHG